MSILLLSLALALHFIAQLFRWLETSVFLSRGPDGKGRAQMADPRCRTAHGNSPAVPSRCATSASARVRRIFPRPAASSSPPRNLTTPRGVPWIYLTIGPSSSGAQHIALSTADILVTARRLRELGLATLPIPNNYYEDLDARLGLDPLPVAFIPRASAVNTRTGERVTDHKGHVIL